MSKRRDPNDIKFDAQMRSNELTRKRLHKRIPKCPKMEYLHRVADEYADLQEKILKLEHSLWREEPIDGGLDVVSVFTDFATSLPYRARQLLISQRKAMREYRDVLAKRLKMFKYNIFVPKK